MVGKYREPSASLCFDGQCQQEGSTTQADSSTDLKGKAVLVNDKTGSRLEVPVQVETTFVNGKNRSKYVVNIREWMLSEQGDVSIQLSGSSSKDDSSLSARVTMYAYWDQFTDTNGFRHVDINYYETKWTKLDSTVSWRDAWVRAGCGLGLDNGNGCFTSETTTIGTPTNNQVYTNTPSWANQSGIVNGLSWFANSSNITLTRGGSTWSLFMNICHGGQSAMVCDASF